MSTLMLMSRALTLGFSADCANFRPKLFDTIVSLTNSRNPSI